MKSLHFLACSLYVMFISGFDLDHPASELRDILREAEARASRDEAGDLLRVEIAVACERAGLSDDSREIITKIKSEQIRDSAARTIAITQASMGSLRAAEKTYSRFDRHFRSRLVEFAAMNLAFSDATEKAILLIKSELNVQSERDAALRFVASIRKAAGDLTTAIRILDGISSPRDHARARYYESLQLIETDDFARAIDAAERTRDELRKWASINQDQSTFSNSPFSFPVNINFYWDKIIFAITLRQADKNMIEQSFASCEMLRSDYEKSICYSRMAGIFGRVGRLESGRVAIERSRKFANQNGCRHSELAEIGAAEFLNGKIEQSRKTFLNALQSFQEDENAALIVFIQAQAGDIEGAKNSSIRIKDTEEKTLALKHIAVCAGTSRGLQSGMEEIIAIPSEEEQGRALLKMADYYVGAGKPELAIRALNSTSLIKGNSDFIRGQTLQAVSRGLSRLGDVDGCKQLLLAQKSTINQSHVLLGIAQGKLPENNISKIQED